MTLEMKSDEPETVILCVGLQNDRREEIPRVIFNIWVDPLPAIVRCSQRGDDLPDGGGAMLVNDCAYWAMSRVIVGPDATVMYFRVEIPAPGRYRTVVKMWSPEFYGRRDRVAESEIVAVAPAPAMA